MAAYTGRPGVDWDTVARFVGLEREAQDSAARQRNADQLLAERTRLAEESAKQNAIRWQGQQDYQTLIDSGVDPAEALRRTSHKLFFNNPAGQAAIVRATKPETVFNPRKVVQDGVEMMQVSPNRFELLKPPAKTPTPMEVGGKKGYVDEKGVWHQFRNEPPNPADFVSLHEDLGGKNSAAYKVLKTKYDAEKTADNADKVAELIPQFEAQRTAVNAPGIGSWWNRGENAAAMNSLSNQIVAAGGVVPPMPTSTNAPPPVSSGNEVIRLTKDGRKAVFDAATKKFIRFAD